MNKKYLALLPLLFVGITLFSQRIPVGFEGVAKPPVIFDLPEEHKAILFFFTSHSGEAQMSAVEVDASMKVLRSSAVTPFKSPREKDLMDIRGSFAPKGSNQLQVYLKVGKKEIWQAVIDKKDLHITITKKLSAPPKSSIIGGMDDSDRFYFLFRHRNRTKGGKLYFYESPDGDAFTEHAVEMNKTLRMFEKRYSPLFVPKATEVNATTAAIRNKIYFSNGKAYFVSDTVVDLYSNYISRTLYTVVDLHTYTAEHGLFSNYKKEIPEANNVSSGVLDGNLFQMCVSKDYFSLRITRIADRKELFFKELHEGDSIATLLNSKFIVSEEAGLKTQKTFESVTKLSRKMLGVNPFLQVRKLGDTYIIGMGGYDERVVQTSGGTMGPQNLPTLGGSFRIKRAAYFYSVIDARTFTHVDRPIEHTLQEQMVDILDKVDGVFSTPRSTGIFPIMNKYWFGYYSKKGKEYCFISMSDEL